MTAITQRPANRTWVPRADVYSTDNAVVVTLDLPGVDQEGLSIELEKNLLSIDAQAKSATPEGYRKVYGEYTPGNFQRRFVLSEDIDQEGIEAKLEKGVLTLRFPKAVAAVAKKIEVKSA